METLKGGITKIPYAMGEPNWYPLGTELQRCREDSDHVPPHKHFSTTCVCNMLFQVFLKNSIIVIDEYYKYSSKKIFFLF